MDGVTQDFLDVGDRPPWGAKDPMGVPPSPPYLITLRGALTVFFFCGAASTRQVSDLKDLRDSF